MKNKENGITLIALIITIIVMLILVGVTINVALNGGLFTKAKTASEGTQKQVSKEELISAMIGAYDSNGNFAIEDVVLQVGAKWCESSDTNYEEVEIDQSQPTNCIITKENNKFYIDENGSVLEEPPIPILGTYIKNFEVVDGATNAITKMKVEILPDGSLILTITENAVDSVINLSWEYSDGNYYMTDGVNRELIEKNNDGIIMDGEQFYSN